MDFDYIIKVVSEHLGTQPLFSVGDIVAIVVALIALIGVIYSTNKTNKTTERINEDNNKFQQQMSASSEALQKKLNKANIDANIISNARVEWIQNVRQATVAFVTACNEVLVANACNNCSNELSTLREKTQLLILYFGPEDSKKTSVDLLCSSSNDGKNEKIVHLINEIKNPLVNDRRNALQAIARKKLQTKAAIYDNAVSGTEYENGDNEYQPSYQDVLEDDLKYLAAKEDEYAMIFQKIENLSDAMRIYLKIEWNKAKTGEEGDGDIQ